MQGSEQIYGPAQGSPAEPVPEQSMPCPALEEDIQAWLRQPAARLDLRFPPALERFYAAETLQARVRDLRISGIAGCAAALVLAPTSWFLLDDARALVRIAWLQFGLPASLVSQILVWTRLPIAWQEVQVSVVCLLVSAAVAVMVSGSGHAPTSVLLACMVTMLLMALIGCRLSFRVAILFAPCMVAMFGFAVGHLAHQTPISALLLATLMAVIAFYALFGTWRLEAEARRTYALMLRARLNQQNLSQRNDELSELSRRDPLTSLANRRAYDSWLASAWAHAYASGQPLGLIVADVDSFKLYNDFYGHPAGDVCLQSVAAVLHEQLRDTTDLVARIGGEEFCIILPGISARTCGDIAERLRVAVHSLELPHFGVGTASTVSISLGAASLVPADTMAPRALAAAADRALYAAKQAGRNCVFVAGIDLAEGDEVQLRARRLGVPD